MLLLESINPLPNNEPGTPICQWFCVAKICTPVASFHSLLIDRCAPLQYIYSLFECDPGALTSSHRDTKLPVGNNQVYNKAFREILQ